MLNKIQKPDYRKKFLEQYRKISKQMEDYEEKFSIILDKQYFELCYFCKFQIIIPSSDMEDFDIDCEKGRIPFFPKDEYITKCGYFRNKDNAFINLNSMHIEYLEEIIEETGLK